MPIWNVERSMRINVPPAFEAVDFDHLRDQVLELAQDNTRPITTLLWSFFDPVLHVGFVGDDGRKRRFMRLRRAA